MKPFLLVQLLLFCLLSCKKNRIETSDSKNQNNLEVVLSPTQISAYFDANPEDSKMQESVRLFYKNRNYHYAWFTKEGLTQAVPNFQNQLSNYAADFDDFSLKNKQLDTLITLIKTNNNGKDSNQKQQQNLELVLTTTFFKYAQKAFVGSNKNIKSLEWYIPRSQKNFQVLLDSLVLKDSNDTTYQPVNKYYTKLKEKLHLYRLIQKKGGFPPIEINSDSVNYQIKKRLVLSTDLIKNDNSLLLTKELQIAITTFQKRLGLPENGIADKSTIAEMNKSVDFRIKQMLLNLERLRWIPVDIEDNYILINIPEFKLYVFENKKQLWQTKVVVGKEAKQTTIFKGAISRVIFNPYWNVPNSIINQEILPKLKQNSNYLEKNNMEVVTNKGKTINSATINWNKYSKNIPFIIRQKPSKNNALGKMKFLFPNDFSIYLHDTPAKELFSATNRDFSHGCIRVQNPKKLALYLLQNNKNWNEDTLQKVLVTNTEIGVAIQPSVAVYITYFTAWVDQNNHLNFRNDLYGHDTTLAKELFLKD